MTSDCCLPVGAVQLVSAGDFKLPDYLLNQHVAQCPAGRRRNLPRRHGRLGWWRQRPPNVPTLARDANLEVGGRTDGRAVTTGVSLVAGCVTVSATLGRDGGCTLAGERDEIVRTLLSK